MTNRTEPPAACGNPNPAGAPPPTSEINGYPCGCGRSDIVRTLNIGWVCRATGEVVVSRDRTQQWERRWADADRRQEAAEMYERLKSHITAFFSEEAHQLQLPRRPVVIDISVEDSAPAHYMLVGPSARFRIGWDEDGEPDLSEDRNGWLPEQTLFDDLLNGVR